jgi:hypothetical protein
MKRHVRGRKIHLNTPVLYAHPSTMEVHVSTSVVKLDEWWDVYAPLGVDHRFNHGEACIYNGERTGDYRGRLFVKRTRQGWEYFCHNCGVGGFRKYTAKDLISMGQVPYSLPVHGSESPPDKGEGEVVWSLPNAAHFYPAARRWLHQYGITEEEREKYGLYCTNDFGGRLILPLRSRGGSRVVGFQARWMRLSEEGNDLVDKKKIKKYLTFVKPGETGVRFRNYTKARVDRVCVVEDIVSAIKVGRHIPSLAMLGTWKRMPNSLGLELSDSCTSVVFWLDPDKADLGRRTSSGRRVIRRTAQTMRSKNS